MPNTGETDSDLTLDTGIRVIYPGKSERDPCIHLDNELTIKTPITKVVISSSKTLFE